MGAHWFVVPFLNLLAFSEYFGFYLLTTIYMKEMTVGVLFICLFPKLQQQKQFFFYINSTVEKQHVLFVNKSLLLKVLVLYFRSNIPLLIEKYPMEKFCKILQMELKMYTPVSPRIFIKKIKFKVFHYIQHDFICQCLGLSKDQASMFKCFVIN